jgi:hypothetical protein
MSGRLLILVGYVTDTRRLLEWALGALAGRSHSALTIDESDKRFDPGY